MVAVTRAGVDTWSPCWYVDRDSLAAGWLDQRATIPTGRGRLVPDDVAGHRIGWDRASGMLYAEGHPDVDGLCAPGKLPAALDRLVAAMLAADLPVPNGRTADVWMADGLAPRRDGFAGIRRLDTTVDLAVASAPEGHAILAGVAALADSSGVSDIFRRRGVVETVYFRGHGGKRVLGRWYDKGAESGSAPPGRLIRPEDQRRFVKGTRRDVTELGGAYVRERFHQRFATLYQASKGVTVAGPIILGEKLAAAVQAGEISATQAERVAGHLLLAAVQDRTDRDGPSLAVHERTARRRRAVARELGLVLADGVLQEVEVNLHDVLEECMDAGAWGCDQ